MNNVPPKWTCPKLYRAKERGHGKFVKPNFHAPCANSASYQSVINLSFLSVPIPAIGHHAATVLGWVGCIFARTHFGFSYIAADA